MAPPTSWLADLPFTPGPNPKCQRAQDTAQPTSGPAPALGSTLTNSGQTPVLWTWRPCSQLCQDLAHLPAGWYQHQDPCRPTPTLEPPEPCSQIPQDHVLLTSGPALALGATEPPTSRPTLASGPLNSQPKTLGPSSPHQWADTSTRTQPHPLLSQHQYWDTLGLGPAYQWANQPLDHYSLQWAVTRPSPTLAS